MSGYEYCRDLIESTVKKDPVALQMQGKNPIAPDCPTSGIYEVVMWSKTTRYARWNTSPPQGWNHLVEKEKRTGDGGLNFVVIFDYGGASKYCVELGQADFFSPLSRCISDGEIRELAKDLSEEY